MAALFAFEDRKMTLLSFQGLIEEAQMTAGKIVLERNCFVNDFQWSKYEADFAAEQVEQAEAFSSEKLMAKHDLTDRLRLIVREGHFEELLGQQYVQVEIRQAAAVEAC